MSEVFQLAQLGTAKGDLLLGDWSFTQMFQDFICWVKCLFHDCTCYHHDDWEGNDDSDATFKAKRLAKEAEEEAVRQKHEAEERRDYNLKINDPNERITFVSVNHRTTVGDLRGKLGGYSGQLIHVEGTHGLDDDTWTMGGKGVQEGHTVIMADY